MKGALSPVSRLEKFVFSSFYYSLNLSAGVVLIQLIVGLVSGVEYGSLDYLYRIKLVYIFYPSFGMCLCLIMMLRSRWNGIDYFFIPFGSVFYCQGVAMIYGWNAAAAVSILDLVGAVVNLVVYLLFAGFIFFTTMVRLRHRLVFSGKKGPQGGVQRPPLEVNPADLRRSRPFGAGQRFLLQIIPIGLAIDSMSLLWQSSPRWLTLRYDDYFVSSIYINGRECFVPVIFNLVAVALILKGWKNVSLWLPYLLIFLSHRAFFPAWEEWLPTPIYILWADRALVVLILVNTAWSFLNWLKLRGGLPKANV